MIKVTKASAPELEGVRTEPATPLANRPPLAASLPTSPVTSSANLRLHFSIRHGSAPSDPSAVPHYTSDFPSLIWLLYLLHSHQAPSSSTLPGCYPGMIHRAQDRDSRRSRKRKREPLLQGKVLLSPAALGLASTSSSELPTQRPVLLCTAAATAPRAPGAPRGPR